MNDEVNGARVFRNFIVHRSSFTLSPMNNYPTIIPAPPRKMRKRRQATAAPAALTLVAAEYSDREWVRLTFDRAIDIAAIDGSQIIVDDEAQSGDRFDGTGGATLMSPATVQVNLNRIDSASESGVHLIVSASSGIVASDDGGTWEGVSDLALPYP